MATCTGNKYVQIIERTECIGNSLTKINSNFKSLDTTACDLSNLIASLQTTVSNLQEEISNMGSTSALVGSISYFPSIAAPTGWLALSGQLVSRSTYSNLWTFANSSGNIVTNADWSSLKAYGAFSQGNGSTTFRLPDLRGYFVRGFDLGTNRDTSSVLGAITNGSNVITGLAAEELANLAVGAKIITCDRAELVGALITVVGTNSVTINKTATAADTALNATFGRVFGIYQPDVIKAHNHTGSISSVGNHTHKWGKDTSLSLNTTGGNASAGESSGNEEADTSGAGAHGHTLTIDATGNKETRPKNIALLACIKY